ncbi:DUF5011 domain-containing protein [Patescibacteria group bacterium]|nr:DUF5011 domain-containing protein [Patescibacteria group bacterium]
MLRNYSTINSNSLNLYYVGADTSAPKLALQKGRPSAELSAGDGLGQIDFFGTTAGGNALRGAQILGVADTGWTGTGDAPGYLSFLTTPDGSASVAERMRITSAGNVGIGTTTPTYKLDVVGSGDSVIRAGTLDNTGSYVSALQLGTGNGVGVSANVAALGVLGGETKLRFMVASNAGASAANFNSSTKMVIDNNGLVGIGTTSPAGMLHVYNPNNSGESLVITAGGSSANWLSFRNVATPATDKWVQYLVGNDLRFYDTADRLTLQSGGNIGIGTTTPGQRLSVAGNIFTSGFFNAAGATGGYQIDGNSVLYASSTNFSTFGGQSGGTWFNATSTVIRTTAFGYRALNTLPSAGGAVVTDLTAFGYNALAANTADGNSAFGSSALTLNTTGTENAAFGSGALGNNTTGSANVAIGGRYALDNNRTGSNNVAIGRTAMDQSVTGSDNVAVGTNASRQNTSATSSVAIGSSAAHGSNGVYSAQGYTAVGYRAGYGIMTGADYNTFIGYGAGNLITTGSKNIVLGAASTLANSNITSGANNILIGNDVSVADGTASNQINIANILFGTGNSTTGSKYATGQLGVGSTSPFARFAIQANNGDTNTTLFAIGSSTATATTTLFTVLNSGFVGINNTAPTALLDITETADNTDTAIFRRNSTQYLAIQTGAGGNVIKGYTGTNTSKPIVFNSTTDSSNTTPTGTNSLGFTFQTLGSTKVVIDNAGNLGLGTTSPGSLLYVSGSTPIFTFDNTNASGLSQISFKENSTAKGGINQIGSAFATANRQNNIEIVNQTSTGAVSFWTNSGEAMRIDSSRNVGIGTTSPAYKLSVEGSSTLGNQAIAGYFTATSTTASSFAGGFTAFASSTIGGGTQTTGLTIYGGATTTGNAYFAGNVGIGTAAPDVLTDIVGTPLQRGLVRLARSQGDLNLGATTVANSNYLQLGGREYGVGSQRLIGFGYVNGVTALAPASIGYIETDATAATMGDLIFLTRNSTNSTTAPSERLRITSAGNLGLGTTSPYAQLSIATPAGATGSQTTLFAIASSTPTATTTLFAINNLGQVAIGTSTPSSSSALTVQQGAGNASLDIRTTTDGAYLFSNSGSANSTLYLSPANGAVRLYDARNGTVAQTLDIWNGNTRTINFASNGVSYLNGGNVGIGTTSPSKPLHIYQTGVNSTAMLIDGSVNSTDWTAASAIFKTEDTSTNYRGLGNYYYDTTGQTEWFTGRPYGGDSLGSSDAFVIARRTSVLDSSAGRATARYGSALLTVTSAGNVGIGTTSPYAQLSIATPAGATGSLSTLFAIASSTPTATTTLFAVTNTGNVGVGTAAPSSNLSVAGSGAAYGEAIRWSDSAGDEPLYFAYSGYSAAGATTAYIGNNYNSTSAAFQIRMMNAKTPVLTALGGGNIGIGSTTPLARLSVDTSSLAAGVPAFAVGSSTQSEMLITQDHRVLFGTTANTNNSFFKVQCSASAGSSDNCLELHAPSSGPWMFRMYNDAYSPTTPVLGGFAFNSAGTGNNSGVTTGDMLLSANTKLLLTVGGASNASNSISIKNIRNSSSVGLGIGTTSPSLAYLTVATPMGTDGAVPNMFLIASSTGTATTTLFTVNNQGDVAINTGSGSTANVSGLAVNAGGTLFQVYANGASISRTGTSNTSQFAIQGSTNVSGYTTQHGSGLSVTTSISNGGGAGKWSALLVNPTLTVGTNAGNGTYLLSAFEGTTASTSRGFYVTAGAAGNNTGVGSTTPFAKLSVHAQNGDLNTTLFAIGSSTATATTTLFAVTNAGNVGIGTSSPTSNLTVVGSGCFSVGAGATVACGTTPGNIYYTAANTGNYDVAERYATNDQTLAAGDVVALDPQNPLYIEKAKAGAKTLGVISSNPGLILGGADALAASTTKPVALSGRVPVKVNLEGGDIAVGDSIVLSSTEGVATKATSATYRIGVALQPWTAQMATSSNTGTIEVFIKSDLYVSDMALDTLSSMATSTTQTLTASTTSPVVSGFSSTLNSAISGLGSMVVRAFNGAISATVGIFNKVYAKEVHTDQVCLSDAGGETCITKAQLDSLLSGVGSTGSPQTGGNGSGGGNGGNATSTDTVAPTIILQGNNPATISIGSTYSDMGATVTDNVDQNLGFQVSVDGGPRMDISALTLDTSTSTTYTILFSATDAAGNTGTATRTVIVQ